MTDVELLRQRVETLLDRPMWHTDTVPACEARDAILAALDEPLPARPSPDPTTPTDGAPA